MAKKTEMGFTIATSDSEAGILQKIKTHYGSEKRLLKQPCGTKFAIQNADRSLIKMTYVHMKHETYYFSDVPNERF